jgi:hypothetical protein
MAPTIPKSRISCLIAENKHQAYDDGEGWDLNFVRSYNVAGSDETYDTAWKVEVPFNISVYVDDCGCQDRMHHDWKENCYLCVRTKQALKRVFRTAMNRAFPEPQDKWPSSVLLARRISQGTDLKSAMIPSVLANIEVLEA